MVKKISVSSGKLTFEQKIEGLFEKKVTKFGTGAKIDAPKNLIGKKVIVFIKKD